jgi:hypothetical protein
MKRANAPIPAISRLPILSVDADDADRVEVFLAFALNKVRLPKRRSQL